MKRALSRSFTIFINPKASPLIASISGWSSLGRQQQQPRWWYSSKSQPNSSRLDHNPSSSTENSNGSGNEHHRPLGNHELKRQIEKFYDGGDEDDLSSIFEAILKRKLAGIKGEEDAKLMKDLDIDHPLDRSVEDAESDSESDEEEEDDDDYDSDSDYDEDGYLGNAKGVRE